MNNKDFKKNSIIYKVKHYCTVFAVLMAAAVITSCYSNSTDADVEENGILRNVAGAGSYINKITKIGPIAIIKPSDEFISSEIQDSMEEELDRVKRSFDVKLDEQVVLKQKIESVVSEGMSLEDAGVKESNRYADRLTYSIYNKINRPIFVRKDRNFKTLNVKALKIAKPFRTYFRSSANKFNFRKILDVKAINQIPKNEVISMAKEFLVERGLVSSIDSDEIASVRVCSLMDNEDTGAHKEGRKVLLTQGVRMGRNFQGLPVVNSKIAVDFHPDSREIVGFKHYNWSPIETEQNKSKSIRTKKDLTEITQELESKVEKYKKDAKSVRVAQFKSGWFQTDTELIPIFAFRVEVSGADRSKDNSKSYTEYVNLTGDDDDVFVPYKIRELPKNKVLNIQNIKMIK